MRSFRQRAVAEARRDGLNDEQHSAMMAELDRRIMDFQEKWRGCRDGRCRRGRQCLGPPLVCNNNGGKSPWTSGQYRRLKRDIIRNPPRVDGAPSPVNSGRSRRRARSLGSA